MLKKVKGKIYIHYKKLRHKQHNLIIHNVHIDEIRIILKPALKKKKTQEDTRGYNTNFAKF